MLLQWNVERHPRPVGPANVSKVAKIGKNIQNMHKNLDNEFIWSFGDILFPCMPEPKRLIVVCQASGWRSDLVFIYVITF